MLEEPGNTWSDTEWREDDETNESIESNEPVEPDEVCQCSMHAPNEEYEQDRSDKGPGPMGKMWHWLGLGPEAPRLREVASRSVPGTPGALGGGPVQPPGGPGGTKAQVYRYQFEDPEGAQGQPRRR